MDSLVQGKLSKLEDLAADIRRSLAQVRFGGNPAAAALTGGQQAHLGPADYQGLFDPGFLQFVVLDPAKAKSTFEAKPDSLARDVKDALGRTQPPLPPEMREQFEGQIVMSLQPARGGQEPGGADRAGAAAGGADGAHGGHHRWHRLRAGGVLGGDRPAAAVHRRAAELPSAG